VSSYHRPEHGETVITEAMVRTAKEAGLLPAVVHDLLRAWADHHRQVLQEQRDAIRAQNVPESCGEFADHPAHDWGGGARCPGNGPGFERHRGQMLRSHAQEFPDGTPRLCDTRITTGLPWHPEAYCVRRNGHEMYDSRWKHHLKRWDHYGHSFYEGDRAR